MLSGLHTNNILKENLKLIGLIEENIKSLREFFVFFMSDDFRIKKYIPLSNSEYLLFILQFKFSSYALLFSGFFFYIFCSLCFQQVFQPIFSSCV